MATTALIKRLRGHTHHPERNVFAPCQRCEAANELERLQALVLMGARVVNDFLPNIGRCALQDYGALNQFLLEAEKVNGDAEPH